MEEGTPIRSYPKSDQRLRVGFGWPEHCNTQPWIQRSQYSHQRGNAPRCTHRLELRQDLSKKENLLARCLYYATNGRPIYEIGKTAFCLHAANPDGCSTNEQASLWGATVRHWLSNTRVVKTLSAPCWKQCCVAASIQTRSGTLNRAEGGRRLHPRRLRIRGTCQKNNPPHVFSAAYFSLCRTYRHGHLFMRATRGFRGVRKEAERTHEEQVRRRRLTGA